MNRLSSLFIVRCHGATGFTRVFYWTSVSVDSVVTVFGNKLLFYGVGFLALLPTPNLGDQVLLLVCPLPCNLPGYVEV